MSVQGQLLNMSELHPGGAESLHRALENSE